MVFLAIQPFINAIFYLHLSMRILGMWLIKHTLLYLNNFVIPLDGRLQQSKFSQKSAG